MTASKTVIRFTKSFISASGSYKTEIQIVFGKNPRGEKFQHINQVNTANSNIDSFTNDFEDFKLSIFQMISLITDEGYELTY